MVCEHVSSVARDDSGELGGVPGVRRNKALAVGAVPWLDELPEVVLARERDWAIAVGRPLPDATEAFVAEARLDDGTPAC